jgi:hypothetical protein
LCRVDHDSNKHSSRMIDPIASRNPVIQLLSERQDAALDAYGREQSEFNRYRVAVATSRLVSAARQLGA